MTLFFHFYSTELIKNHKISYYIETKIITKSRNLKLNLKIRFKFYSNYVEFYLS